jgi:F-type H+-transporting ATPase subunit gamma
MKVVASRKFPTSARNWGAWRVYEKELEGMLDVMYEAAVMKKDGSGLVVDTNILDRHPDGETLSFLDAAFLERFPSLRGTVSTLATSRSDWLFIDDTGRNIDKRVIVVVGSNNGYCGGFNRSVKQKFELVFGDIPKKTLKLLCIGRKCRSYFRKDQGLFKDLIQKDFPDEPKTKAAPWSEKSSIASGILNDSVSPTTDTGGQFYPLTVVYNKLSETLDRQFRVEAVTEQILPIVTRSMDKKEKIPGSNGFRSSRYLFEPDMPYLRAVLSADFLYARMMRILCESEAAEQYSRMRAMSEASENIGNEIELLMRSINKTRQASITRELIEIISGAEAFSKSFSE